MIPARSLVGWASESAAQAQVPPEPSSSTRRASYADSLPDVLPDNYAAPWATKATPPSTSGPSAPPSTPPACPTAAPRPTSPSPDRRRTSRPTYRHDQPTPPG